MIPDHLWKLFSWTPCQIGHCLSISISCVTVSLLWIWTMVSSSWFSSYCLWSLIPYLARAGLNFIHFTETAVIVLCRDRLPDVFLTVIAMLVCLGLAPFIGVAIGNKARTYCRRRWGKVCPRVTAGRRAAFTQALCQSSRKLASCTNIL